MESKELWMMYTCVQYMMNTNFFRDTFVSLKSLWTFLCVGHFLYEYNLECQNVYYLDIC